MAEKPGTLELIAQEISRALQPLEQDLAAGDVSNTLARVGVYFPPEISTQSAFISAIAAVVAKAAAFPELIEKVQSAVANEDLGEAIQVVSEVGETVVAVENAIDQTSTAINNIGGALPGLSAQDLSDLAAEFTQRLLDLLLIDYLEGYFSVFLNVLYLAGLAEKTAVQGDTANVAKPSFARRQLKLERLPDLLSKPGTHFKNLYDWGDPVFTGEKLLEQINELFLALSVPTNFIPSSGAGTFPSIEFSFARIRPRTDLNPGGVEILLSADLAEGTSLELPFLYDNWNLSFGIDLNAEADTSVILQPGGNISFVPPASQVQGKLDLSLIGRPAEGEEDFVIFGQSGGTRLAAAEIKAGANCTAIWDSAAAKAKGDFGVEAQLNEGQIVIDLSQSDSFIADIFPDEGLTFNFELLVGWSGQQGFYFGASGGLEIVLPLHISLGGLNLENLHLLINISDGKLKPEVSIEGSVKLGALNATVSRIGIISNVEFPGRGGNLGPLDMSIGFKPPSGVGLSVDAGAVKGGGYLYFDLDREEYAGALELVFSEWITLKAIGLITTKMPDGSKGFSLLVIITAEFGSGIQLGFGFTLNGVGGILGLNRIVNVETLKDGIRTGAVESVMFPTDVVANAPKIISDLRQFFPVRKDIFLVGPMTKIGWGTPTLVTAKLGVILEFPNIDITILGVIKVVLPDEEADILRLQVNFMGRIEPSNKLLWFYAELFDSRVLFITLEGGFGLLVNWGDNANFVVSVGGFHPKYNPPPLPFPEPPRLAVNILNESYAKIRIEAYFAVTSNSVQFGARAELYFGVSDFRIEGHLAFDALFQFDPFFFSFGLSVGLSVKVFGIGLFSVGFSGLLEGPTPWHIEGKGKISILFFKISVPFKHTWGDNQDTKLDPIEIFPLLEAEFDALANWEARVPASNRLLVSLRELSEAETDRLVLHPVGKLRVSQRKIPVNFTLDKVGNNRPSDVNRIDVNAELPGAGSLSVSKVEDKFAIGQFKDLGGSDQLSKPGFEPLESGIEIGIAGEQLKTSRAVRRVIRYESIIIDNNFKEHIKSFFGFFVAGYAMLNEFVFTHFMTGNSATQSVHSKHQQERMQPFGDVIEVKPNLYSVASTTDNRPLATNTTSFTSLAKAQEHMDQQIQSGAASVGDLHVIPNSEMNLAA